MKGGSSDFMLVDQVESEEQIGIPICDANLSTPVTDTTDFINEIHYQIGNKLYIENADQPRQIEYGKRRSNKGYRIREYSR